MSFFSITLSMFLIMNSVGHIMGYLELVERINSARRRYIIVREMGLALIIMIFFYLIGDYLLEALEVNEQTVSLAGGLILFLIAIRMIFPNHQTVQVHTFKEEPFIFPIATPMVAGPSILTTIMLYAHQDNTNNKVAYAILIAWVLSITVLLFAQQIKNVVGRRALIAVERLMGLLLTMMSVEMLLKGISSIIAEGIK